MFRIVMQGLIVFIMSLALGGAGVYLYSTLKEPKKKSVNIKFLQRQVGLVDEVFDDGGALMDQLAYTFDNDDIRARAVETINRAGIVAKMVDDRVMVESGKAGLALDVLSLKDFIPGVRNFSFTDVTAIEGSIEYKVQNRLATQNMLANMIETMAEGVEEASVELESEAVVGDIDGVKVMVLRRDGVNGLNFKDLEDIKLNIIAMTGISDKSIVDIVDVETGKSF